MPNETLEQQRKAREEFLKLKKMQQGEIDAGPKPSEVALTPQTFEEKRKNFWFHYKWHTIGIIFTVIVLTVLCVQCATREKSDFEVIYFSYEAATDSQLNKAEKYLESFAKDINGDGLVNINILNCSFSEEGDRQYRNNILTKVQTQIIGNKQAVMYILDDKAYEYLNGVTEDGVFDGEGLELDKNFYKKTKSKELGELPQGLKLYLRRVKGTVLADDQKVEPIYKECKRIIEKIEGSK